MSGRKISLGRSWVLDKDGKIVKSEKHLDVSKRIAKRKRASKGKIVSRARAGRVA